MTYGVGGCIVVLSNKEMRYKDMNYTAKNKYTEETWKVCGAGLTALYITGKDVDEVLAQARLINPNYNSVQLYSKEVLK